MKDLMVMNTLGLSNEQIKQACPSVFAEEAHSSRSSRYSAISTGHVLEALREAGFVPVKAMQAGVRDMSRFNHTKHLLRLRRMQDIGLNEPDVREVVLVNAADGTAAYNLYCGVFRIACTNGLVTGDIDTKIKVYHKGDVSSRVVEGSITIINQGEEVMSQVDAMKQVQLSRPEQVLLAQTAFQARYGAITDTAIYNPEDLLRVRRFEDRANDLYTTYNRIQESLIGGKVNIYDQQTHKRRAKRAVNGIDQNVKLNQLLWGLAQGMMKIKQAE